MNGSNPGNKNKSPNTGPQVGEFRSRLAQAGLSASKSVSNLSSSQPLAPRRARERASPPLHDSHYSQSASFDFDLSLPLPLSQQTLSNSSHSLSPSGNPRLNAHRPPALSVNDRSPPLSTSLAVPQSRSPSHSCSPRLRSYSNIAGSRGGSRGNSAGDPPPSGAAAGDEVRSPRMSLTEALKMEPNFERSRRGAAESKKLQGRDRGLSLKEALALSPTGNLPMDKSGNRMAHLSLSEALALSPSQVPRPDPEDGSEDELLQIQGPSFRVRRRSGSVTITNPGSKAVKALGMKLSQVKRIKSLSVLGITDFEYEKLNSPVSDEPFAFRAGEPMLNVAIVPSPPSNSRSLKSQKSRNGGVASLNNEKKRRQKERHADFETSMASLLELMEKEASDQAVPLVLGRNNGNIPDRVPRVGSAGERMSASEVFESRLSANGGFKAKGRRSTIQNATIFLS